MSVRPTPLSTELSNVNVGCFVWLKIDSWLVVPLCLWLFLCLCVWMYYWATVSAVISAWVSCAFTVSCVFVVNFSVERGICPRPAFVAEWLTHSAAMCSRAWRAQWPGFDSARARPSTKELLISNDSYAHDEQGDNPEQVTGLDGVLYKLWPLLMPWLAAPIYQSRRRESRSR